MVSSEKKPSQDLDNFISGRKNSTERYGPEYLRTAITLNPGTALISWIWDKLRTSERRYQEQRQSLPDEFNPDLGRKWFWIITGTGLLLPFSSFVGLALQKRNESGVVPDHLLVITISMGVLFLTPFLIYAAHSRKRLRGDKSQLGPVVGGFIGLSAVYTFFYLFFLPWASLVPGDFTGMAQALTVYFLFIVPLIGLGAVVLGRKLSPPRPAVWVSGMRHGVPPDKKHIPQGTKE